MINTTVSHYKIIKKIGEGGMGIVYKAVDTKLDRLVAIKVLPHHLTASSVEKKRFIREAKVVAALNHPNVCILYEIQDEADPPFLVMEYVDGQTLSDIISQTKNGLPMPLEVAVNYALQICQALQEAHNNGIIHRDIKSDNIMVNTKDQIKVMDFGLAKLKGSLKLTTSKSTLGTLAYISPEQLEGQEVDARADIWSFGVVLYEMLTGELPFKGEYESSLIFKILNGQPEKLKIFKKNFTDGLQGILDKLLCKNITDRYKTIGEVIAELKTLFNLKHDKVLRLEYNKFNWRKLVLIGTVCLAILTGFYIIYNFLVRRDIEQIVARTKIVVLPFENLGSAEDDYFADGLTEETISRISAIDQLGVIARTSAIQYKNTDKKVQQIGKELDVEYVIEGTIRWQKISNETSKVRITAQLVKVSDATHIWSKSYDAIIEDIFQVQSDIAEQVAEKLNISLINSQEEIIKSKPTNNLQAYNYYMRGRNYLAQTKEQWETKLGYYEKAVKLDPLFGLAYAILSIEHSALYGYGIDNSQERIKKARAAVDSALVYNPDLPEAHLALGCLNDVTDQNYEQVMKEFETASVKLKNNSDFLFRLGQIQFAHGKLKESIKSHLKLIDIDPLNASAALHLATAYLLLREYKKAEKFTDYAISINPNWYWAYHDKAFLYIIWQGNREKAMDVLNEAPDLELPARLLLERVSLDIYFGHYTKALNRLILSKIDSTSYYLNKAWIYNLLNKNNFSKAYYDSAINVLEPSVQKEPTDAKKLSQLGLAYAGIGLKDKAVRVGVNAIKLIPENKKIFYKTSIFENLAKIYVMVGQWDFAINQLEYLLSNPSPISIHILRIDPVWLPLQNYPRFQRLIKKNINCVQ